MSPTTSCGAGSLAGYPQLDCTRPTLLAEPTVLLCGRADTCYVSRGAADGVSVGSKAAAWVAELFTRKYPRQEDMWLPIMFAPTQTSQAAGHAHIERIIARTDRDAPVSDQSIAAQRSALAAYGAAKDPSYAHLKGLELPVLVVNGTHDIVIPTINSYILQQFLPKCRAHLVPRRRPRRAFQYPELFVRHARIFLDD